MGKLCCLVVRSGHTEYEEFVVDATIKRILGHFVPNKNVFSFYSYMNCANKYRHSSTALENLRGCKP